MQSLPTSFDQLTLGGKRPILIGKLNAEPSKAQIEAVEASSEQIHFSKNSDRLNSVNAKFELADLAASGNGKKDGSVDSASVNQQQLVLNSFTPPSASRQFQAFKGLSNEQAAALADVHSIEVSSLKNTTQPEASIDSAMAKFDVDRFNEEVGKIVKNQLVNSFSGKNISVKILLSPESLGQVEVDLLFSKDSEIQITLRTENAEVAKLMQANATVLRDQLAIEHKGNVALNINDSRNAEFGFQGNQRDEANSGKHSIFVESDSGESNNALEKSSVSGDGSNSLIDTFA
ncbi:MAG: flagellar hook-length control protein FliK, partial [Pseudomonadales bacterium]